MMKALLPATVLALSFSVHAFAADEQVDSKSTLKIEEAADKKNKVAGDIDEEITNAKLRAESGSKSKWSMSFTSTYSGASLEKPLDKYRPNTSQETTPPKVSLGGDIGVRYRINKNNSLSLGTGYSLQQPFHNAKYGDISDPYLAFNNAGKIGGVQNILSVTGAAATNHDEVLLGTLASADITDVLMYDFNGSKASVGIALEAGYSLYRQNKDALVLFTNETEYVRAGGYQRDYTLAAYPMFEYAFNDRFNFRSVFRPWIFDHSVDRAGATFKKRNWTQSIGLGIAVTRDIYLYPNFQFAWEDWRGDDYNWFRKNTRANSTVGLSATVNVF